MLKNHYKFCTFAKYKLKNFKSFHFGESFFDACSNAPSTCLFLTLHYKCVKNYENQFTYTGGGYIIYISKVIKVIKGVYYDKVFK